MARRESPRACAAFEAAAAASASKTARAAAAHETLPPSASSAPSEDETDALVARDADYYAVSPHREERLRPAAGAAAALSAAVFMAGFVVIGKHFVGGSAEEGDPGALLLWRQLLAAPAFVGLALLQHGVRSPKRSHYHAIVDLSLLHFMNALLFVWGMRYTTAFITSVMQLTIPVFALAYARLWSKELVSAAKGTGVMITVAGCALVTVSAYEAEAHEHHGKAMHQLLFGIGVLAAQCVCFVGMLNVQRTLIEHYPILWVLAWTYIMCTVWIAASCFVDGSYFHIMSVVTSVDSKLVMGYSALFGCIVYVILIAFATKHLGTVFVSLTVALEPLIVSAITIICCGYAPKALDYAGYAVAFAGTIVSSFVSVTEL